MEIAELINTHRSGIIKRWFDFVIKTYPNDSSHFLINTKDPFANPVGATIQKSLEDVFDALVGGKSRDEIVPLLDPVIRIRAVQEFIPSESVVLVFHLRTLVREFLKKDITEGKVSRAELDLFDDRIDGLCLIAFDIYMSCREQIFKFRAEHVKSRTLKLLEKADILCEVPDVGTEIIPHNVYKNGGFESQ